MPHPWRTKLDQLLHRPLFGTKVISPDVAVDPSRFPEAEFPVRCTQCDYLLRGLPDGKCPECGREFNRGNLLVRQYVLEHGQRTSRSSSTGRWAKGLAIGGFLLLAIIYASGALLLLTAPVPAPGTSSPAWDWVGRWGPVVIRVVYLGPAMMLAGAVLYLGQLYRNRAKRRRIIASLDQQARDHGAGSSSTGSEPDGCAT